MMALGLIHWAGAYHFSQSNRKLLRYGGWATLPEASLLRGAPSIFILRTWCEVAPLAGCPTLRFLKGGIPRPSPAWDFSLTPAARSFIECADDPITHPFRKEREKDGAPGIEWLALTFDEIIEVVLSQQLIQLHANGRVSCQSRSRSRPL
jgi:hypothetical protein